MEDLYAYRISNRLIGIGLLTGIGRRVVLDGCAGMAGSVLGILLPVVCLFPAFLKKGIGSGDIKLLSVVGSYLSYNASWNILLASVFLGGVYAMIRIFMGEHKKKLHMSVPIMLSTLMWLGGWI